MRTLLLIIVSFTAQTSFGHDSLDWRTDTKAFEYSKNKKAPSFQVLEKYPEFYINPKIFEEKLSEFSGKLPVTLDGKTVTIKERASKEGREYARMYLAKEFTKLGFEVSYDKYDTGVNIIAEKKGTDPTQVLILSAHIDSVGNAGANDDGSGTISALLASAALAEHELKYTLRFVGFDEEELGTVGSNHYVTTLSKDEKLIGAIQAEMMGTNKRDDGAFHVIDCDKANSIPLTKHVMAGIGSMKLKVSPACTDRSDHRAFWKKGLPAIVISENFFGGDSDPCYHKACDVVDKRLNFDYMSRISAAITSAAAVILQAK